MHPRDYSQRTPDDFDGGGAGGGTPDTCGDFWRLCVHRRASVVVMLCKVQRGFTGCSQYFPAEKGEVRRLGGDLAVRCLDEVAVKCPGKSVVPKLFIFLKLN